jgi:anti-anti-sigma regulatory factor
MKVKIDTKERMHVITVEEEELTANMTEQLSKQVESYLNADIQNVVLVFRNVRKIEPESFKLLFSLQQSFYTKKHSLVFCEFQPAIENTLRQLSFADKMNITPTESEAWDMVQMEEIERELS